MGHNYMSLYKKRLFENRNNAKCKGKVYVRDKIERQKKDIGKMKRIVMYNLNGLQVGKTNYFLVS